MARALLEVRVRRHADQRDRELLAAERVAQGAELPGDARPAVLVVDVVRVDDPVLAHADAPSEGGDSGMPPSFTCAPGRLVADPTSWRAGGGSARHPASDVPAACAAGAGAETVAPCLEPLAPPSP